MCIKHLGQCMAAGKYSSEPVTHLLTAPGERGRLSKGLTPKISVNGFFNSVLFTSVTEVSHNSWLQG